MHALQLTLKAWRDLASEPERNIWLGFSAEYVDENQDCDVVLCWRGTVVRLTVPVPAWLRDVACDRLLRWLVPAAQHAEEWTINLLGDVLTYWKQEPPKWKKLLYLKFWRAARVHKGFKQLYCTRYEHSTPKAAAVTRSSAVDAELLQPAVAQGSQAAQAGLAQQRHSARAGPASEDRDLESGNAQRVSAAEASWKTVHSNFDRRRMRSCQGALCVHAWSLSS